MTDRDTFAAAALTGLIANGDYSVESTPLLAYRMADAMLRERGTADRDNCVGANQPEMPYPVTKPMPKEKRSDVCAAKPLAWAVMDGNEAAEFCTDKEEAGCSARYYGGCHIVPLYATPQPTLTDAEREAVKAAIDYMTAVGCSGTVVQRTLAGIVDRYK